MTKPSTRSRRVLKSRRSPTACRPGRVLSNWRASFPKTPRAQPREGYRILKLLEKREAGQVQLSDPQVQQSIRSELTNRKQQLLSAAFSEQLHNEARVENLLAREILGQYQK